MLYQALRPCRFDRLYLTGEIISSQVILPKRIPILIQRGDIRIIREETLGQGNHLLQGQVQVGTKEQLRQQLRQLTGKEIPKYYTKNQLLHMILQAQVGEEYDKNIHI